MDEMDEMDKRERKREDSLTDLKIETERGTFSWSAFMVPCLL